jgi:hypothetical protein
VDLAKLRVMKFPHFGDAFTGILTLAELQRDFPFEVRRVFWTYGTPPGVTRGGHAHYTTETVIVAVSGRIVVSTELPDGKLEEFTLDSPDRGLYLPPLCWRTMRYTTSAVQVTFESEDYCDEDYIRGLDEFRAMRGPSVRERC